MPSAYYDLSRPLPLSRKRSRFYDVHEQSVTEYYRQECLFAFYRTTQIRKSDELDSSPMKRAYRRRVHFNAIPLVLGTADSDIDRTPAPLARITKDEMIFLLAARVFPLASTQTEVSIVTRTKN